MLASNVVILREPKNGDVMDNVAHKKKICLWH